MNDQNGNTNNLQTQNDWVLQYMEDFGSITPMDAMMDLGVMRLAARINDLRKRGVQITSEIEAGENRYGHRVHYARYKKAV